MPDGHEDGGYQGAKFRNGVANVLPGLEIEIVKRRDHDKGFVALPRRWIVERTIAWLNRCGKGLGKLEPQGAGLLASRIHSRQASKAL